MSAEKFVFEKLNECEFQGSQEAQASGFTFTFSITHWMPSQSHIEKLGNSPGQSWWEGTMDHWKIEREKREYKCRWTPMINIFCKKKNRIWYLETCKNFAKNNVTKFFIKLFFHETCKNFAKNDVTKFFIKLFFHLQWASV